MADTCYCWYWNKAKDVNADNFVYITIVFDLDIPLTKCNLIANNLLKY